MSPYPSSPTDFFGEEGQAGGLAGESNTIPVVAKKTNQAADKFVGASPGTPPPLHDKAPCLGGVINLQYMHYFLMRAVFKQV